MISAGDFRNGITIELEGNIYQIIEFQHVKPGKGAAFVRTKLKSESGKLIIMFCIIMSFVVAGFEHCIANMSTFSIGYMLLGNIGTVAVIKSMIVVTIGNILGGAVLLGVPVQVMKAEH